LKVNVAQSGETVASSNQEQSDVAVWIRPGLDYVSLMYAYCRWRAEGLFPDIFHECPEMTLEEFLDWNYLPTVEPVGCFHGELLIGVGWICGAWKMPDERIVAEAGAAFFRGTPYRAWRAALRLLLRHAFVDRGFSAIYGISSVTNRAARILRKCCGMEEVNWAPWRGPLPEGTVASRLFRAAL
jgi:aryl carrier-like protein